MDENNSAQDRHTEQNEGPAIQDIGDQRAEEIETTYPTEEDPEDAFEDYMKSFWRRMKAWWTETDLTKRIEIVIAGVGLLVLIVYTFFSALQWAQIRYTNNLTARALDGNDKALSQTLLKMQGQIDATNNLYGEAQKQTMHAGTMATNSGTQATAMTNAANAAKRAAHIADQTLHISERAYLILAPPAHDFSHNAISIPVINTGHIPSGRATVIVHVITFKIDNPTAGTYAINTRNILEKHWNEVNFSSVPLGNEFVVTAHVHAANTEQISSGKMGVAVAAVMTYNDGFPTDAAQTWYFCDGPNYSSDTKTASMTPCDDPQAYARILAALDGYPDVKNKEN